ncbi:MAG: fluoride efflux transporter CrcB [Actinomycetales bacterium]
MPAALLVVIGAAVGAPLRFVVDRTVRSRTSAVVPWGIVAVNVVGAALLGLLTGLGSQQRLSSAWLLLLGTGFCGSLTTFSTFAYDVVAILERRRFVPALVTLAVHLVVALPAAALGWQLSGAPW